MLLQGLPCCCLLAEAVLDWHRLCSFGSAFGIGLGQHGGVDLAHSGPHAPGKRERARIDPILRRPGTAGKPKQSACWRGDATPCICHQRAVAGPCTTSCQLSKVFDRSRQHRMVCWAVSYKFKASRVAGASYVYEANIRCLKCCKAPSARVSGTRVLHFLKFPHMLGQLDSRFVSLGIPCSRD